jgi:transposase
MVRVEGIMRDSARLDDRLQARDEAGAYQRIELITGRQVRRRWSADEKAQIIAESAAPGAKVSDVARRHGVNRGLLTVWRRQARRRPEAAAGSSASIFVPVAIEAEPAAPDAELPAQSRGDGSPLQVAEPLRSEASVGTIDVELSEGRVRLSGAVDPALARAVIAAVRSRG